MVLYEVIAVGLAQLRANKLRSFLTLLGIMIGVAAVIGIVSLGEGLRRAVMADFAQQGGAGTVVVQPPLPFQFRDGRVTRRTWREYLTTGDLDAFAEETEHIDAAVPRVDLGNVELRYGKAIRQARVIGTSATYAAGLSWEVERGRALGPADVLHARRVCVVGRTVGRELFQEGPAVGQEIKLNGERYTVIGVLAERVRGGMDEGGQVFIPYTTAQKRFTGSGYLADIALFIEQLEAVEEVAESVRRVLRRRHAHGEEFQVRSSPEEMAQAERNIRIMKQVAGGMAGISLLVGGIGIMNIMLVSVSERTREIGVRKALGAKPRHILFQFVAEAVVLSLAGAAAGVAVGVGFGLAMERLIRSFDANSPFASIVAARSVLWAVGFASVVGLFFGIYPAVRASRLDPVDALRYE